MSLIIATCIIYNWLMANNVYIIIIILTIMMANIGATNVQMAYVPLPEDSQQLKTTGKKYTVKLQCSMYIICLVHYKLIISLTICIAHFHLSLHIHHVLLQVQLVQISQEYLSGLYIIYILKMHVPYTQNPCSCILLSCIQYST